LNVYDRWRNNFRISRSFIAVNLIYGAVALLLYGANERVFKPHFHLAFVQGHFNDVLATGLLLAYSNILIALEGKRKFLLLSFHRVLLFSLIVGLGWEYLTPLYKSSTTDPLDLLAYGAGGIIYFGYMRLFATVPPDLNPS